VKITRIGWMMCLGAALAACGGESRAADATDGPAEAPAPALAEAPPLPPAARMPPTAERAAAPVPTAADSAAAVREDVSPEWKMNQRNMAPYADCMAQANTAPEEARARLAAACANLPDAPK
jgi:hypothetical protein